MTETVLRLRGDAKQLVWPAASLDPLIDRCDALRNNTPAYAPLGAPPSEQSAAHSQDAKWWGHPTAARWACMDAFAAAQGWTRATADFRVTQLLPTKIRRA